MLLARPKVLRRRRQACEIADHLGVVRPIELVEQVAWKSDLPLREPDGATAGKSGRDLNHLVIILVTDEHIAIAELNRACRQWEEGRSGAGSGGGGRSGTSDISGDCVRIVRDELPQNAVVFVYLDYTAVVGVCQERASVR